MGPSALAAFLREIRHPVAAAMLFGLGTSVLSLAVPVYLLQMSDRVVPNRSLNTLVVLSLAVVVAILVQVLLESARNALLARIGSWYEARLTGDVLHGAISTTLREGAPPSSRYLRELQAVRDFLAGSSVTTVADAPWTVVFLLVIAALSPFLGLLTLVAAVALLIVAWANERSTRGLEETAAEARQVMHDRVRATLANADAIEAMGMAPAVVRRVESEQAALRGLALRAHARGLYHRQIARAVRMLAQVGVIGSGAWLVVLGELTMGGMIASVLLMRRALAPMDRAVATWRQLQQASRAFARTRERLERQQAERRLRFPAPRRARLEVERLTYYHPGASSAILRRIRFSLEPGEILGLVGPTAAGKSTLARLLVGNLRPYSGHVRLDRIDLAAWDPAERGRFVGYLPQDVELFPGTVAENIARFGDAPAEDVVRAARQAGVHELVLSLPDGYDTLLDVGSRILSGGQRQRIGLARALFGDPMLVVLDEPDSNLDREGQRAVALALERLRRRRAVAVVVTHRPELLACCSKILVLERSRLTRVEGVGAAKPPQGSTGRLEVLRGGRDG